MSIFVSIAQSRKALLQHAEEVAKQLITCYNRLSAKNLEDLKQQYPQTTLT